MIFLKIWIDKGAFLSYSNTNRINSSKRPLKARCPHQFIFFSFLMKDWNYAF